MIEREKQDKALAKAVLDTHADFVKACKRARKAGLSVNGPYSDGEFKITRSLTIVNTLSKSRRF